MDYLIDSRNKDVLQASVGELGISNGGMFKCSRDHSESQEEHSEIQSRGTSQKHSEAQQMQSNLEASHTSVKGNLEISQLVTLVFSIKQNVS